jgi:hypothetical protein
LAASFSNGRVVVYFWEGAEVARIHAPPSTIEHPEVKPVGEGGVSKREEGT